MDNNDEYVRVRKQDLEFLQKYHISWVMMTALVLNMPEFSGKQIAMCNRLGMYFFRQKCYDKVIPFLDYAYSLDQENKETKNNIVTVLEAFGEPDLAKTFKDN